MKYIIVDDETAAHDNIRDYASNVPYLSFQKSCYNAFEVITYLNDHMVDLIFLDINMPKLSGFDFLKSLKTPPKIIVTTAYSEYAVEGFELRVDDYLLKPYSLQRFLAALNKIKESDNGPVKKSVISTSRNSEQQIFLKDDKKHYQVKLSDIMYLEAYGNYVKVHLTDQTILTHQTLTSFETSLSNEQFIRVHKSFIVAIPQIELIEGNRIYIKEHKIPIGKIYKQNVIGLIR